VVVVVVVVVVQCLYLAVQLTFTFLRTYKDV
jgi:hypothetical protein